MIVFCTDFARPYRAQMELVLARLPVAPGAPAGTAPPASVTLFEDLPAFNPKAAAYLLAAYLDEAPEGAVFCCVVDPGVGGERPAVVLQAGGRWFVGPDNGLLAVIARRAERANLWNVTWRPPQLSNSFHGRDLFTPLAARLARGETPDGTWAQPAEALTVSGADWPEDLAEVIYLDGFGNAMTGLRATRLPDAAGLRIGERQLPRARTFGAVPPGTAFCYENANGLLEIAVNQGAAGATLGLTVGSPVAVAAKPLVSSTA